MLCFSSLQLWLLSKLTVIGISKPIAANVLRVCGALSVVKDLSEQ